MTIEGDETHMDESITQLGSCTEVMAEHTDRFKADFKKRTEVRDAAAERIDEQLPKRARVCLHGWTVHVEKGIFSPQELQVNLVKNHMRRAPQAHEAQLYVCKDIVNPGLMREWLAGGSGRGLCPRCRPLRPYMT